MCPRSGGTCERTLVLVFVPGEHANRPPFRCSFREHPNVPSEHPPKPPFCKPAFCQPPNIAACGQLACNILSNVWQYGWEKESIHRPAPAQNFSLPKKKRGPQRKDFSGGYGFLCFYRVIVSTTGLECFSLQPEKFPKRFSFGGGRVRFYLLCIYIYRFFISDSPTTTTTIFELISRDPFFIFGVPPDAAPKALSTQWNRKTQRFFLGCAIKCRFDVASDAKLFWKIMVVVVFGPSPIFNPKTESKKSQNRLFFNCFDSFATPFLTFWAPGPRGFRTHFRTLFQRRAQITPVAGKSFRNSLVFFFIRTSSAWSCPGVLGHGHLTILARVHDLEASSVRARSRGRNWGDRDQRRAWYG